MDRIYNFFHTLSNNDIISKLIISTNASFINTYLYIKYNIEYDGRLKYSLSNEIIYIYLNDNFNREELINIIKRSKPTHIITLSTKDECHILEEHLLYIYNYEQNSKEFPKSTLEMIKFKN
jgi:hypothetical protein